MILTGDRKNWESAAIDLPRSPQSPVRDVSSANVGDSGEFMICGPTQSIEINHQSPFLSRSDRYNCTYHHYFYLNCGRSIAFPLPASPPFGG